MRKALWILTCTIGLLLLSQSVSYASSDGKTVVAFLPVVNNTGLKGDHYTSDMVDERMTEKFGNGKYSYLSGQVLLDELKQVGIDDPRGVDNATLMVALKKLHVDYCVRAELLVVVTEQKMIFPNVLLFIKTWTATVPLYISITDVNQGAPSYESTIVENGRYDAVIGFAYQAAAVKAALNKDLDRFDREAYISE